MPNNFRSRAYAVVSAAGLGAVALYAAFAYADGIEATPRLASPPAREYQDLLGAEEAAWIEWLKQQPEIERSDLKLLESDVLDDVTAISDPPRPLCRWNDYICSVTTLAPRYEDGGPGYNWNGDD